MSAKAFKQYIKDYLDDFKTLFFPPSCLVCNGIMSKGEKGICLSCYNDMPRTLFSNDANNPVNQMFFGRIPLEFASAYISFSKFSKYHRLLHLLKYDNRPDIGVEMGRMMGQVFLKEHLFPHIDYIVPVPLHPKKEKIRGYNQSDMTAEGLQNYLDAKISIGDLIRHRNTATQTKKNQQERQNNVKNAFSLSPISELKGKSILLIDDVVTTGATLENCARVLIEEGGCKVSVFTFAIA